MVILSCMDYCWANSGSWKVCLKNRKTKILLFSCRANSWSELRWWITGTVSPLHEYIVRNAKSDSMCTLAGPSTSDRMLDRLIFRVGAMAHFVWMWKGYQAHPQQASGDHYWTSCCVRALGSCSSEMLLALGSLPDHQSVLKLPLMANCI